MRLLNLRHVKEGEVVLLLDSLGDLLPLFFGGVNTSRVVCACVKEDDGFSRCSLSAKT